MNCATCGSPAFACVICVINLFVFSAFGHFLYLFLFPGLLNVDVFCTQWYFMCFFITSWSLCTNFYFLYYFLLLFYFVLLTVFG